MQETDLRHRDVEFFQYNILPTILLLLMISGLINGGLSTAREWESHTVKELLLSPVSRGAIIVGKVMAGFAISFSLGVLVLLLGYVLGWTQPEGVYWLSTLLTIALVSLLSAGLGVAIGAMLRSVQVVIAGSINVAIYLLFLEGGNGVLAFEPTWLQNIAAFVPLTYGRHTARTGRFLQRIRSVWAGYGGACANRAGCDCAGYFVYAARNYELADCLRQVTQATNSIDL